VTATATTIPVLAEPTEARRRRPRPGRFGPAPVLATITWLYVIWSILPVLIAIAFSFNKGRSRSSWQGFSLRWWFTNSGSVAKDPALLLAIRNSLILGAVTIVIVVPLGVALAIGLARWRSRLAGGANLITLFPLVTPEIVMGASLFVVFTQLYTDVPLGRPAQILGHVTFTLSFVVVIVRGRLSAIGPVYEEAARDLGANAWQALRLAGAPAPAAGHLRQRHHRLRHLDRRLCDRVVPLLRREHRDRAHPHLRLGPRWRDPRSERHRYAHARDHHDGDRPRARGPGREPQATGRGGRERDG
jgi:ABC-type spermidine/putrescine transport system permease subunit II